jgi:hypothetical protein
MSAGGFRLLDTRQIDQDLTGCWGNEGKKQIDSRRLA